MFDPLASGFGDDAANGWQAESSAQQTTSPIPPSSHASSPLPRAPSGSGPVQGLYGKEPQIYGAPEPGLISPRETVGSNGASFEKPDPYLRVRITGLDRNRRDILVRLDAQTNLSNFSGHTYRNVQRSYVEFQQFYESIMQNNPHTIVPALPLAQTSAPSDEEDDRLVKIMLQRWITRVCEDTILHSDEDLRSFIENDFGYQPTPRPRKKGSSGFGLMRRGVPDEDEELQRARFELTKLEGQFFDTAKAIDKLAVTRKTLASTYIEMGNKLMNVATTEAHPPLGNAFQKIGRTWHSLADLEHAQAISECVVIGDSLGYQGMNARSAKDTLLMRTGTLEEYQSAVKTTISKRRQIERLKASSNIRPERVDDALEDLHEAEKYEQTLARRADGISQNLHTALQVHNRYANDDITTALIEHARSSIMYERQFLRELEALRADVGKAADKALPAPKPAPRPTIIPPLEDVREQRPFAQEPPASAPNGVQRLPAQNHVPTPPHTSFMPGSSPGPSSQRPPQSSYSQQPSPALSPQAHFPQGPLSPPSPMPPQFVQQQRKEPLSASGSRSATPQPDPLSPAGSSKSPVVPSYGRQTPNLTQSSPSIIHQPIQRATLPANEPPLGGKFVDGTKSMFVQRTQSPLHAPPLGGASSSSYATPAGRPGFSQMDDPLSRPGGVASPLHDGGRIVVNGAAAGHPGGLDPLGQIQPRQMSSTVRVTPQRPRLDAREAASKLANMF